MIRSSEDVFVVAEDIASIGCAEMEIIKKQAARSDRKRARVCAHRDVSDSVHEMLIAIHRDSYIHPHRHLAKPESFHVVEGAVDVVVLDDAGVVTDVLELGSHATGRKFFYRMSAPAYHTLLIQTEFLVVHEVTAGPFSRDDTQMADFAPVESDRDRCAEYMAELERAVSAWRSRNKRSGCAHDLQVGGWSGAF